MSNDLAIAMSGKSGCGNSTVSRLLAARLGLRLINYTFHDMAVEMGTSFEEVCRRAEQDEWYDLYLDRRQMEMARQGPCVLASRLAVWLLKEARLKVYLQAPLEIRAARVSRREGLPLEVALLAVQERDERDRRRYLRLYGIDIDEHGFVDLLVDTESKEPRQIVEIIREKVEKSIGGPLPWA